MTDDELATDDKYYQLVTDRLFQNNKYVENTTARLRKISVRWHVCFTKKSLPGKYQCHELCRIKLEKWILNTSNGKITTNLKEW